MVNQLATPGLGSLMGGRILAGIGQLILAVVGFIMICGWFLKIILTIYHQLNGSAARPLPFPWLGQVGALTFFASWIWALVTSFSLLNEAKRNETGKPD